MRECLAKPGKYSSASTQTVFDHCRYTGHVAMRLLEVKCPWLTESQRRIIAVIASLHDIGKISPDFQGKNFAGLLKTYNPGMTDDEFEKTMERFQEKHAVVGQRSISSEFLGIGRGEEERENPICKSVGSHHGEFRESNCFTQLGGEAWKRERLLLIDAMLDEFGCAKEELVDFDPRTLPFFHRGLFDSRAEFRNSTHDWLCGAVTISDWIASNIRYFPYWEKSLPREDAARRAAYAVRDAGFVVPEIKRGLSFEKIFTFPPREFQSRVTEEISSTGIYVVESATGSGKTEAALYAAYRLMERGECNGIYFALPTTTTSDAICEKRIQPFLSSISKTGALPLKLAHGLAWLHEHSGERPGADGREGISDDWMSPAKRRLLCPFAVGTIDQMLKMTINVRHNFVRSFALAGKVVILDEMHSYDAYMDELSRRGIRMLANLGATVIILSATLLADKIRSLLSADKVAGAAGCRFPENREFPLLTGLRYSDPKFFAVPLGEQSTRDIRLSWTHDQDSLVRNAIARARKGMNVVCILNTVDAAQELYRRIKSKMAEGEFEIGLLHSRFRQRRRKDIEDRWIDHLGGERSDCGSAGAILVSTQIVEQSLDIDADWIVSEIAPIDMLMQRMGRLWRKERKSRPCETMEFSIYTRSKPHERFREIMADPEADEEMCDSMLKKVFGKTSCVYSEFILVATMLALQGKPSVSIPRDTRSLLESVYDFVPAKASYMDLLRQADRKEAERMKTLASGASAQSNIVGTDLDEQAQTRHVELSEQTVPLLLARDVSIFEGGCKFRLLDSPREFVARCSEKMPINDLVKIHSNIVQAKAKKMIDHVDARDCLPKASFRGTGMPFLCEIQSGGELVLPLEGGTQAGMVYDDEIGLRNA